MQPDKYQDREMESYLNEIPNYQDYHPYHQDEDDDGHRRRSVFPSSRDMHGHGDGLNGTTNLIDLVRSMRISEEPIVPFGFQGDLEPLSMNPPRCSVPSFVDVGFDPYWDSNALNLSILRSPTRSLSPVEAFDGFKPTLVKRRGLGRNAGLFGSFYGDGYIYLMAKDQSGCRFLQKKFGEGRHYVDLIFDGVIGNAAELMMDPFGNYLMQKLFDVCSEEQLTRAILVLTDDPGTLLRISQDIHGTRSVQKLIMSLKNRQQIALVMAALRHGCFELIMDVNGNHVVQRCLKYLNVEDTKFIFEAATEHCVEIATHRHGCCVLQHCIGASSGGYRANLVAEICSNGIWLAQDAYGNYVVQYILGLGSPSANAILASQFEGNYVHLSMQKFSSNVVEKCFKVFGEEDKVKVVSELLSVSQFEQLLQHPYANYVIHSALLNTKGALFDALVKAIYPHAAILRTSPYCKRIFVTLSKKSNVF